MYAEDFGGYDGGNGKTVEYVYECLPCLDITAAFALVIKTVNWTCQRGYEAKGEDETHLVLR